MKDKPGIYFRNWKGPIIMLIVSILLWIGFGVGLWILVN